MKRVLVNFTEEQLEMLDKIIDSKFYKSRSEAIRDAITILIEKEKAKELEEKLK